jgi:hypothetical protein
MGRWMERQTERYLGIVARYVIFDKSAAKIREQNNEYKVAVT